MTSERRPTGLVLLEDFKWP